MYKIMLADDEGIVIEALQFIIQKNFGDSCTIEYAKTGRSVIELAEIFRPDIAFMDIQMPGINGIEAMKEIKKTNPATVFIVLSAYDKFDYAREAINLGVLDYLNKPIEQKQIVDILKKTMLIVDKERESRSRELRIKEKLETVVPVIESGLIYSILFQEHFEEDIENFKQLLGISENYGYMAVLVFGENQEGNHMTNAVGAGIQVQNQYGKLREIVKEYFQGLIGPVMANKVAIFVPWQEDTIGYNERIEVIERSERVILKLKKSMEVQFRIGIGSVRKLMEARESYNEAISSLINSTGKIAHVKDLAIGCDYEQDYPIGLEKDMFDAIQKGDSSNAYTYADRFYEWIIDNYEFETYTNDIKLKVIEFVLWAEHLAYESGGMTYRFESRADYLPTLIAIMEKEELRSWFLDKIADAARNIIIKKDEAYNTLVEKAKGFMNQEYGRDISLDEVSREVDISPYYFSKLFKEETGENFIEYLTNLRIEKAKELLENSDRNMKEICAEVGYMDPNYFSRIFKKNVGVTPTEYKER